MGDGGFRKKGAGGGRLVLFVLAFLLVSLQAANGRAAEKVILDTDMVEVFDDGVAMVMLARDPRVELLGVTVTAGNAWVAEGVAFALRQLELAGQPQIPVFAGVREPLRPDRYRLLKQERELFGVGEDQWVGAFSHPEPLDWRAFYEQRYGEKPRIEPKAGHAADFIIEQVRRYPGQVTIAAIGPCGNLALALRKAPEIAPLIKRVVYMGGAFFRPGNVTPAAEFNWWFDPEAARIAVRAPLAEQLVVGLDVCETIPFTASRYQKILAGSGKSGTAALVRSTWLGGMFASDPQFTFYVWDVVVAAVILDPTLITGERTCFIDVDTQFGLSYGRSYAYPATGPEGARRARIVTQIDQERFWALVEKLYHD